ncbi:MAG: transcription antitermination factor NusB [Phycisphaerales bacterium]|nr:transcription antitermination factor NusB [Phycisphaerales bacterium]
MAGKPHTATVAKIRHPARMLALQALCAYEGIGDKFRDELAAFLRDEQTWADIDLEPPVNEDVVRYAQKLANETWAARAGLDAQLGQVSGQWSVSRMTLVDRNILRMALWEIRESKDVPWQVAIDEAVEIAKRFSDTRSAAFVNGLLDSARKLLEDTRAQGGEPDGAV